MTDGRNPWLGYGRNKYGAYVCYEENGKIINFTQLFKSGELWGIDTRIDKNRIMSLGGIDFGFFPCVAFEQTFVLTLNNYLKFDNEILKLPLPLKFIAGATDVMGYRMSCPPGMNFTGFVKFAGNVVDDHIIFDGIIEDYSENARTILRQFFEYVWEECGLVRPDKERLDR